MEISIDYLSYTIPFEKVYDVPNHMLGPSVEQRTNEFMGDYINAILDGQTFSVGRPRAPYSVRWGRADGGVSIFAGPTCPHILVEVTGTGCDTVERHEALLPLVSLVRAGATRLDVACDIQCDERPNVFATQRKGKRFKSTDDRRSVTGDTYYVGSFNSDRFARVYRYAEPHPRSHLLRVEHVYRRDYAKELAKTILSTSLRDAAAGCGVAFGWEHPLWQPESATPAEVRKGQKTKNAKDTVRWLYGTVTQSVAKQVKADQVDLDDFIEHLRKACQTVDNKAKWAL